MTSAKSLRLAALAAVASLAFSACAASTTPSPSTSTAPSAAPSTAASEAPSVEPGALPTPELTSIKIGLSNTEMSEFAPVIAADLGIFEKYGIKATYSVFEGDAKVMGALQAGQIDIGYNGTSSVISSQLTDAPAVVIGVNAVVLTDDLVCQADIKTADDVKGKKIAISSFGGTSHGSALLLAKSLNLAPTQVVFTVVGGQTSRIAALTAKSIDCAVVDANLEADMTAQGFAIPAHLKTSGIAWGRAGMDMLKSWIKTNPNTALVALAATLEGQNLIWTSKDASITDYMKLTGLDKTKATAQISDFQIIGNRSLMWTDDAFNNPRKILATVNPDIIDVPLGDSFDRSYLKKLVDIGFYDKIGSPVPNPIPGS